MRNIARMFTWLVQIIHVLLSYFHGLGKDLLTKQGKRL
jgi:hypothetical protein